jgi:hypothetical protein
MEQAQPKVTPWFDGRSHKPSRPGVYQQMSGSMLGYQYWDGSVWWGWAETISTAHAMRKGTPASPCYQTDNWRGLTEGPN